MFSQADRDPNRQHWLIEEMMKPVFERDESMFLISMRLFLLQVGVRGGGEVPGEERGEVCPGGGEEGEYVNVIRFGRGSY